jgi:hypothetical protein
MKMEQKSYVGMSNCFLCGKPKEILLDRRLKDSLPREAVYNKEPCKKCKEYMEQGIILISVRDGESGNNPYRTGGWVVIKEEAVKRIFNNIEQVLKSRVAFIEYRFWDKLGLPRGEIKEK